MFLIGVGPTVVAGEYGFGEVVWERTSYVQRGDSKEYTGTTQNLWAIAAGRLPRAGRTTRARRARAGHRRSAPATPPGGWTSCRVSGLRALSAPFFKEFVVDFSESGRTVAEVNRALRERGIFGGLDLSGQYPELGQSALVCVTEVHTKADIDRFADELAEVLQMTLRPFHQASWNEPILLELSSPGERGIIPPQVEEELVGVDADPLAGTPRRAAPLARAAAARAEPAACPAPLHAPVAGDARQRREHPSRSRYLHDEVQPEGERGVGPFAQGRRSAPAPG